MTNPVSRAFVTDMEHAHGREPRRFLASRLKNALAQIHSPQVVIGEHPLATLPSDATYALGWLVDSYHGHKRLSHAGYLCDIHSSVMLFPDVDIGIVTFVSFGSSLMADLISQHVFDALQGLKPIQTVEERWARYKAGIVTSRKRRAEAARVMKTTRSRPLSEYHGKYRNVGYGEIGIHRRGRQLVLKRYNVSIPLKHWHYDVWIAEDSDRWPIHVPYTFDPLAPLQFHLDARGSIASLSVRMEPELAPIVFDKQS